MIEGARYSHTNIVARDWRALAGFYESVFGCMPVPPERDYSGPVLEAGTGIAVPRWPESTFVCPVTARAVLLWRSTPTLPASTVRPRP